MKPLPVEMFVIKGRGPIAVVPEGDFKCGQEVVLRATIVGVEMNTASPQKGLVLSRIQLEQPLAVEPVSRREKPLDKC